MIDDNALDYILSKDMNKQSQGNQNKPGKAGCLGALVLFALPVIGTGYTILNIA